MNKITSSNARTYGQTDKLSHSTKEQTKAKKQAQTDRFVKSTSTVANTYKPTQKNRGKLRSESDMKTLSNAIGQSEQTASSFKKMLISMLKNQVDYHEGKPIYLSDLDLTKVGVPQAASDEILRLNAQFGNVEATGAVGENDYWGVDQTAQRIFDFAIALSGNDADKLEMLKGKILQAFGECEQLFGGQLPNISYKTLDKINTLFDDYTKQNQEV